MISRYVYSTYILNTKLHGKCFCISLIRQQLVRKYRTRVLSIQYSSILLYFKRCFLFSFTGSQHFRTRQNLNQSSTYSKPSLFNILRWIGYSAIERFSILGQREMYLSPQSPSFFPSSLSPTPFDACYAGYVRYAFRNNEMRG